MKPVKPIWKIGATCVAICTANFFSNTCIAQQPASFDTPMTRMKSIHAPSAVDPFRSPSENRRSFQETAFQRASTSNPSRVRQAALWQGESGAGMPLPNGPMSGMPGVAPNAPPSANIGPTATDNLGGVAPRGLPSPPAAGAINVNPSTMAPGISNGRVTSPSDHAYVPQPQLGGFANVANCNLVTAPSGYTAATGIGCGCNVIPATYNAPALQVPVPATMPPVSAPATAPPANVPLSQFQGGLLSPGTTGAPIPSLVQLGQRNFNVQVGQGLWGQPKAYVPGQVVRNWVRYFFP